MPRKMPDPYEPPNAFPIPGLADASELAEFIRLGVRAFEAAASSVAADGKGELLRVVNALDALRVGLDAADVALQLTAERAMAARLMTQRQLAEVTGTSKTKVNLYRARPVSFERVHELERAVDELERARGRDDMPPPQAEQTSA